MISKIILKIRKKEGKINNFIYKVIFLFRNTDIPYYKPFYIMLFWVTRIISTLWKYLITKIYFEPMLKSLCLKVGSGLRLAGKMPYVNENLRIIIGNNVTIYGDVGFQAYKVYPYPILEIGDNSFIGPQVHIGIGKEVKIGKHCLIAARVFISDHDGHPLDWRKRRDNLPADKENIKPIIIEDDAWIGEGVFICKGVKIGRGAIVAARAVVTKNVAPFTIVGGNPAILIRNLEQFLESKL
jgi:acetyltransferase-like isoleucine patch superfamily enzyme